MEQTAYQRVQHLAAVLNQYRHEYYNLNAPTVSDEVYDRLFDELTTLEQQTGLKMSNSPTQTVGYPSVSKLEKTQHAIPLLSLDKTKSNQDLLNFMGEQLVMLMLKLDGLTMKLTYENGVLQEASTRGDGDEGEIVAHNVPGITGIPTHIPFRERLVVTGEAFIRPSDFAVLKNTLVDSNGNPYKNGRNLAAGSVRLLDAKVCKDRRITFMAFNVLEGMDNIPLKSDRLNQLWSLGFTNCYYLKSNRKMNLEELDSGIKLLREYAKKQDIPIDGVVIVFRKGGKSYVNCNRPWKQTNQGHQL